MGNNSLIFVNGEQFRKPLMSKALFLGFNFRTFLPSNSPTRQLKTDTLSWWYYSIYYYNYTTYYYIGYTQMQG